MSRWGIVGSGWAARDFAAGLTELPGAQVVAVASPRNASRLAASLPGARAYATAGELVADPEVEVVYVASPNSMHREHCLAAIEAGKAVACEKPFALDAAEGRTVIEAARARGVFCMEAMPMRFVPATLRARELLAAGAIGEVHALAAAFGHRPEHDRQNRFFSPELGGGAMLDAGVYCISLAVALFGRPVHASATAVIGSTGVDEQSAATLTFDDGRLASVQASLRAELANEAVVSGTLGELRLGPIYRPQRASIRRFGEEPPRRLLRRSAGSGDLPYEGNGFVHQAREVERCLAAGLLESPLMPWEDTVTVLECLDAVRAAW